VAWGTNVTNNVIVSTQHRDSVAPPLHVPQLIRLKVRFSPSEILGEDLVAEAAVGDAADHFFGVHGVGEAEVDVTGFV
jgi:hypothetical protein